MQEYAMKMSFSGRHPAIPGYEPIRVLGQNGAIIYVARSARFDKPVALQVWSNCTLPARAAAVVGLEHPNILGVLDVGEVDGHVYVALEYLEGVESLGVRLRRGPIPETDARGLASVIASVLQFVRDQGVAVAALTPGDVLLSETPKLMLHARGGHYARPDFMAPEEHSLTPPAATAAIDVYRVGALLYAMLTGRSPVSLDSVRATGWQSVPAPVPVRQINPAISKTLETICMKCLEEGPLDRYGSLRELTESVNRSARAFNGGLTGRWTRRRPRWAELIARVVSGRRGSAADR
jgi:serine/threonine-protein kinase